MDWILAMTMVWLKAGHIIFVIFWMAGLFMLPRYFVYHQEALDGSGPGSGEAARWVEREAKLLKIILWPSLIAVWGFGLALAYGEAVWTQGWFHLKLAVVLGLTGYHLWLAQYAAALARGQGRLNGRHLRLLNEVPGLAVVVIVVLVVVKPF